MTLCQSDSGVTMWNRQKLLACNEATSSHFHRPMKNTRLSYTSYDSSYFENCKTFCTAQWTSLGQTTADNLVETSHCHGIRFDCHIKPKGFWHHKWMHRNLSILKRQKGLNLYNFHKMKELLSTLLRGKLRYWPTMTPRFFLNTVLTEWNHHPRSVQGSNFDYFVLLGQSQSSQSVWT